MLLDDPIYPHAFLVDTTPHCAWDYDMAKHNRAFLDQIDPKYFIHFVKVHAPLLEVEEDAQYAAVALRSAYAHGLETLFSLICATLQSPESVVGWMLKYKVSEMESMVAKISARRPVTTDVEVTPLTWDNIARQFMQYQTDDPDKDERMKVAFGKLWPHLADDVVDPKQTAEYKSIKHGLRVYMGGFSLAMGLEDTPGVPAPPERMRLLGRSEFGSRYYTPEPLKPKNFRVVGQSINWNPYKFVYALQLISWSIRNVVATAKVINGEDPTTVEFCWPDDETLFDKVWENRPSITSFNMNSIILPEMIDPLTGDEIRATYTRLVSENP